MPMSSDTATPIRPRIAIPGRFSASASALRFGALVNARALLDAVWAAGGDPVTVLPTPNDEHGLTDRLAVYDGVLMPGGADIDPALYGAERGPSTDEPDLLQDAFDVAVLDYAICNAVPLLTVCRGTQLLNAHLGGTLVQEMAAGHVHRVHQLTTDDPTFLGIGPMEVSCYHHQSIDKLAADLEPTALAEDGVIEAVQHVSSPGWVRGVQWHPEDNAAVDERQQQLMAAFIAAARNHAHAQNIHTTKERHATR
jgi:putative glutamine amidotransferase